MTGLELPIALFLLGNLVIALFAAVRDATVADWMLLALLAGSLGTGILVLLASAMHMDALVDVALLLALLAAIGGVAFARRAWQEDRHD